MTEIGSNLLTSAKNLANDVLDRDGSSGEDDSDSNDSGSAESGSDESGSDESAMTSDDANNGGDSGGGDSDLDSLDGITTTYELQGVTLTGTYHTIAANLAQGWLQKGILACRLGLYERACAALDQCNGTIFFFFFFFR